MKRTLKIIALFLVVCMFMTACGGKSGADNSYYYDYRDWDRAKNKYNRINDRISRYQYTPSERTEIGELQGKCMGYFAKGTVNSITDGITGVINQVKGAIKGAKDAWNNNNRGR